jgi:hypothetical protein
LNCATFQTQHAAERFDIENISTRCADFPRNPHSETSAVTRFAALTKSDGSVGIAMRACFAVKR